MKRKSLSRYLIEQQREYNNIPNDLRLLLEVVSRACKLISRSIAKGALGEVLGSADSENVQGEAQKKLDVLSNEILLEANEWGGHLAGMASEEMETIYEIPNRFPQGEYLLVFDPLDGSSNIDINSPVGTIFSVLKKVDHDHSVDEDDFLQPGEMWRRAFSAQDRTNFVHNVTGHLSGAIKRVQYRQTALFYRADQEMGARLAEGLHLLREDLAVAVVVRHGRQDGRIRRQRQGRQRKALAFETSDQLGREMLAPAFRLFQRPPLNFTPRRKP